jgi:hypothetical protein
VSRIKLDILKGRKLSEVLKTLPPERQATIEIYAAVYALAQTLLIIVPNVTAAAQRLVARA